MKPCHQSAVTAACLAPKILAVIALSISLFMNSSLHAEEDLLDRYSWENRLLLIFAPRPQDPGFISQERILASAENGLAERDLLIIRLHPDVPITVKDEAVATPKSARIYRDFDIEADAFAVLLIGKDGTLKLKRQQPLGEKQLFDLIDSMPMRQLEMRDNAQND